MDAVSFSDPCLHLHRNRTESAILGNSCVQNLFRVERKKNHFGIRTSALSTSALSTLPLQTWWKTLLLECLKLHTVAMVTREQTRRALLLTCRALGLDARPRDPRGRENHIVALFTDLKDSSYNRLAPVSVLFVSSVNWKRFRGAEQLRDWGGTSLTFFCVLLLLSFSPFLLLLCLDTVSGTRRRLGHRLLRLL